jgi:succinate dehydrogenase/fumarate reductase flavoprotein subunit
MTTQAKSEVIETDLLVIGGGTGGPMAAIKAKEKKAAGSAFSRRGALPSSQQFAQGGGCGARRDCGTCCACLS